MWWTELQPPCDVSVHLSAILPRMQSWSPDLLLWGSSSGDRVDVSLENSRVSDLFVRVDMSAPSPAFFDQILAFAQTCEAVFLGEGGDVVEPVPEVFARALQQSRAARFLHDPELYFRRVAAGGYADA